MSELIPVGATRAMLYPAQQWLEDLESWELILPEDQAELIHAANEAVDLAEAGQPAVGHEILLTRLQQAEDHWKGNPWGQELVLCYEEVLARFDRRYPAPVCA